MQAANGFYGCGTAIDGHCSGAQRGALCTGWLEGGGDVTAKATARAALRPNVRKSLEASKK